MNPLKKALLEFIEPQRLLEGEPMGEHTTFRVGGRAELCFFPRSGEEIARGLAAAEAAGMPCLVMGNGSNLIVRDGGVRGLVMILGEPFSEIQVSDDEIFCQAGARLSRLAGAALEHSLTGLEFASGIPGTVGGGVVMNAGAYGGQLSDVLTEAQVLRNGRVETWTREEMDMGYRTSRPLRENCVVLSARFRLQRGDASAISQTMRDLNARRRDKQPLNYPSAGSTFKRPEGYFAGALIEGAGLKGLRVGGAQVSEKHAGFIVNVGSATAGDILELIARVQRAVLEKDGVALETEVRVVGEEPDI